MKKMNVAAAQKLLTECGCVVENGRLNLYAQDGLDDVHLEAAAALRDSITDLHVEAGKRVTAKGIAGLKKMRRLTSLTIEYSSALTDRSLLEVCEEIPNLRKLDVSTEEHLTGEGFSGRRFDSLAFRTGTCFQFRFPIDAEKIVIWRSEDNGEMGLSKRMTAWMNSDHNFFDCRDLELHDFDTYCAGAGKAFSRLGMLERLSLSNTPLVREDWECIGKLDNLRCLKLDCYLPYDFGFLIGMRRLQELELSGFDYGPELLRQLSRIRLPKLTLESNKDANPLMLAVSELLGQY